MTTPFEKLTPHWRELLLKFIKRQDQEQKLKGWCADNNVSYGTARGYFNPANTDAAIAYIATLQESPSDCSLTDLMSAFESSRTNKKSESPDLYLEALSPEERIIFLEMWNTGMSLRGEISLIRFQIYRAKKAQSAQDKAIADGKPDDSLSLTELKKTTIKNDDD